MATPLRAQLAAIYHAATPASRRRLHLLLWLTPLTALAEIATIAAIVPLLALLGGAAAPDWLQFAPRPTLAAAALFVLAALIAAAMRLLLSWSSQRFAFNLGHELSVEIQHRVLHQPYPFHVASNSSEIISSLDKVEMLTFSIMLQLVQAAAALVMALFIIAALVHIDPFSATVAALLLLAGYALVMVIIRRRLARDSAVLGNAYEDRIQAIQEGLGGIRDVIIDRSQNVFVDRFRAIDRRLTDARINIAILSIAPRFLIEAFGLLLITALALWVAAREGSLAASLPMLGALALGAQRLLPLSQQIYQGWTRVAGSRSIIAQVVDLLHLPVARPAMVLPLALRDSIRFDQVDFHYPERGLPALSDINLTIPRGARVALIGPTGSGKSTLADLVMGLLQPSAGQILIDGVALTSVNAAAWQANIAHVPQAIFLADASIARNIAFGVAPHQVDRDRIARAAATAQIDAFIESLPYGYDTVVGERGVRLSGGQRQRIGLARAIYKGAPLLLLDEATSALDDATEAAVLRALDLLGAEGRTILIVAHRQSTIASCEYVVRLEEGRIVDQHVRAVRPA